VLTADPRSTVAYVNLGVLDEKGSRSDLAGRNFSQAMASRPDSPEALNNLNLLEAGKGRSPDVLAELEKALTEYLEVLSSTHSRPEIYIYLGRNYAAGGYGSTALEAIRKAVLVEASLAVPYYYLALAHEKEDPAQAAKEWKQFISTLQRDPNRSFWTAFAEERLSVLGQPP
jgi:tetratricopeptide (TPR) repeat protein